MLQESVRANPHGKPGGGPLKALLVLTILGLVALLLLGGPHYLSSVEPADDVDRAERLESFPSLEPSPGLVEHHKHFVDTDGQLWKSNFRGKYRDDAQFYVTRDTKHGVNKVSCDGRKMKLEYVSEKHAKRALFLLSSSTGVFIETDSDDPDELCSQFPNLSKDDALVTASSIHAVTDVRRLTSEPKTVEITRNVVKWTDLFDTLDLDIGVGEAVKEKEDGEVEAEEEEEGKKMAQADNLQASSDDCGLYNALCGGTLWWLTSPNGDGNPVNDGFWIRYGKAKDVVVPKLTTQGYNSKLAQQLLFPECRRTKPFGGGVVNRRFRRFKYPSWNWRPKKKKVLRLIKVGGAFQSVVCLQCWFKMNLWKLRYIVSIRHNKVTKFYMRYVTNVHYQYEMASRDKSIRTMVFPPSSTTWRRTARLRYGAMSVQFRARMAVKLNIPETRFWYLKINYNAKHVVTIQKRGSKFVELFRIWRIHGKPTTNILGPVSYRTHPVRNQWFSIITGHGIAIRGVVGSGATHAVYENFNTYKSRACPGRVGNVRGISGYRQYMRMTIRPRANFKVNTRTWWSRRFNRRFCFLPIFFHRLEQTFFLTKRGIFHGRTRPGTIPKEFHMSGYCKLYPYQTVRGEPFTRLVYPGHRRDAVCSGDSGAPLISRTRLKGIATQYQVGIVLSGKCNSMRPFKILMISEILSKKYLYRYKLTEWLTKHNVCINKAGYNGIQFLTKKIDQYWWSCNSFERNPHLCKKYANVRDHKSPITVRQACCVCGGGRKFGKFVTSAADEPTQDGNVEKAIGDLQHWKKKFFAWAVKIYLNGATCSGSVVAESSAPKGHRSAIILTARHCLHHFGKGWRNIERRSWAVIKIYHSLSNMRSIQIAHFSPRLRYGNKELDMVFLKTTAFWLRREFRLQTVPIPWGFRLFKCNTLLWVRYLGYGVQPKRRALKSPHEDDDME